ncbi:hypothetical protein VNO80_06401 [Phaseolus coccineus]|uniref:Uncharacterized protein n=1 Tax=Phaseolus coccineus TaxID=3886 RepID=A0AAN9RNU3_PHACN
MICAEHQDPIYNGVCRGWNLKVDPRESARECKRKHSKNQSQPFGSPTNKIVNKTHYLLLTIPLTPFPCF